MHRPLRIAFTGASGTGKTTLAKMVAEAYNLPMEQWPVGDGTFESTTRRVARDMFGRPEPYLADTFDRRAEFQWNLLNTKLDWEDKHATTGFVTDRTHYDNLAYGIMHDIDGSGTDIDFRQKVASGMEHYDIVIYCPTGRVPTSDDPARKHSAVYHCVTDTILYGLYGKYRHIPRIFVYVKKHLSTPDSAFQLIAIAIDDVIQVKYRREDHQAYYNRVNVVE